MRGLTYFKVYKDENCGIYKITSPTGRIYIGQSIRIKLRLWYYYKLECKNQRKLYHSLLKYGFVNHTFEIIHICEREHLNTFERFYIKYYKTFNTWHGMNLTEGGDSAAMSEETKRLISKRRKKKFKDEPEYYDKVVKQLTSISKKGDKNPKYGLGRRILQFDLNGNFIKKYISVWEACVEHNFKGSAQIYNCCYRKVRHATAFKFIWRFEDDCILEDGILKEKIYRRRIQKDKNSIYKGVKKGIHGNWEARFYDSISKKSIALGSYSNELDAVRAINIHMRNVNALEKPEMEIEEPFKVPIESKFLDIEQKRLKNREAQLKVLNRTCLYCDIVTGAGNIARYHNEKCKHKSI